MGRKAAVRPKGRRRPAPEASVARGHSVAEILSQHVNLELRSIDRLYLNVYVPSLQTPEGVAAFFLRHRGYSFASSALMEPISRDFVTGLERYAEQHDLALISFEKGKRKEDLAVEYRDKFQENEGVLFIGKAQEKVRVFRTQKRRNPRTGQCYPWIVRSTGLVNQYYIYAVDEDFGPFFLKFSSYFPYTGRLCLNGHEYVKRQLAKRGVPFEALDNGILSCDDAALAQEICDGLSPEKIEALLRKWLARLPHPFTTGDRAAGYRYQLSILQAEFSLTQIFDRPLLGRIFFEQIIRENLDLGRPDRVQLIFGRRVNKRTPGHFLTRVITHGVLPSLHILYKHSRLKQYFKQGRGGRAELVVNDTRDFGIGRGLKNLPALRKLGFEATRRLLQVETISHDCALGHDAFQKVVRPLDKHGQHASALRYDDARVQALFAALLLFVFQLQGFQNRDLRPPLAQLLGIDPAQLSPGRMTYELRRLRLHGIIERIPKRNRYRLTPFGLRVAAFFSRTYNRLLRPALADLHPSAKPATLLSPLRKAFDTIDHLCHDLLLTA